MSAKWVNKIALDLFMFVAALFILFLTATNIENYLAPKEVLGAETQVDTTENFWQDFLIKNPNYIPGWIEIGRVDKVKEIDPNYELVSGD
jgi:hypothetical protein